MLLGLGSLPADGSRLPIVENEWGGDMGSMGEDRGACKASVVAAPINVGSGGVDDNDVFGLLRGDHDHHDYILFTFACQAFRSSV